MSLMAQCMEQELPPIRHSQTRVSTKSSVVGLKTSQTRRRPLTKVQPVHNNLRKVSRLSSSNFTTTSSKLLLRARPKSQWIRLAWRMRITELTWLRLLQVELQMKNQRLTDYFLFPFRTFKVYTMSSHWLIERIMMLQAQYQWPKTLF